MGIVPKKLRRRMSRRERNHVLIEAAFQETDDRYRQILADVNIMYELRDCFLEILRILPVPNDTVRNLTHLYFNKTVDELAQDYYLRTLAQDSYESLENVLEVLHKEYHFTMTSNDKDMYLEQIKRICGPVGRFYD